MLWAVPGGAHPIRWGIGSTYSHSDGGQGRRVGESTYDKCYEITYDAANGC